MGLALDADERQPNDCVHQAEEPVLVVSPHLDDGVFGCGDLLSLHPGGVVVTVFAGSPKPDCPLTDWDRACGFLTPAEAMRARRTEDSAALALLDARPVWLHFADAQYGSAARADEIAQRLDAVVRAESARTVAFPLGLFHEDHRATSDAMLGLSAHTHDRTWLLYADALYQFIPELRAARLAELQAKGHTLVPWPEHGVATQRKRDAVACYGSQLRALHQPNHVPVEAIFAPEQYWRIV